MTISGKAYTVRPLAIAALTCLDMERYIASQRVDLIAAAHKATLTAPAHLHAAIFDAAMRAVLNSSVRPDEIAEFDRSIRGYAFKFWHGIKADHPEVDSVDKALEILLTVSQSEAAEFEAKVKSLKSGSNQ